MKHRGFTLTELLIVIGLIILFIAMAVPLFRTMTGSRSTEAAENLIAATLARTREEAVRMQDRRGVAFVQDPGSDRALLVLVYFPDPGARANNLDLFAEQVSGGASYDPQPLPNGVGVRFVRNDGTYGQFGVIMFGPDGQIEIRDYQVDTQANLVRLYGLQPPLPAGATDLGLVLFDREQIGGQADEAAWLDQNGSPLLINRYRGTLISTE